MPNDNTKEITKVGIAIEAKIPEKTDALTIAAVRAIKNSTEPLKFGLIIKAIITTAMAVGYQLAKEEINHVEC